MKYQYVELCVLLLWIKFETKFCSTYDLKTLILIVLASQLKNFNQTQLWNFFVVSKEPFEKHNESYIFVLYGSCFFCETGIPSLYSIWGLTFYIFLKLVKNAFFRHQLLCLNQSVLLIFYIFQMLIFQKINHFFSFNFLHVSVLWETYFFPPFFWPIFFSWKKPPKKLNQSLTKNCRKKSLIWNLINHILH